MFVSVSIEKSTNAMWFEVPGPADAEISAPGPTLRKRDEVAHGLRRNRGMHHERVRRHGEQRDGREILVTS